jgi:protocatechuate 3,4-dioxygenase beta subunit
LPQTQVAVEKHSGQDAWEQVAAAKSDADGKFELKGVPPGSYRVTASSQGYAPRALGYVGVQKDTLKRFTIHLTPAVSVGGTVTDPDGRPLAGVKVRADSVTSIDGRGYEPPRRVEATTDEKGKFNLTGLPKGHAQLFAHAKNLSHIDPLAVQTLPSEVTLRMTQTGDVRGKVLDPAGDPVGGPAGSVSISLTPEGGQAIGKWSGSMNVNPDGSYAFENVPPGKYLLSTNPLASLGKDPDAKPVEVKGGETAQVDVTHK